jgi:hypothetical protein
MNTIQDHYEINPCRRDGDSFEKCDENSPDVAVWSVYRRGIDNLAEWLSDHKTKAAANRAALKQKNKQTA